MASVTRRALGGCEDGERVREKKRTLVGGGDLRVPLWTLTGCVFRVRGRVCGSFLDGWWRSR